MENLNIESDDQGETEIKKEDNDDDHTEETKSPDKIISLSSSKKHSRDNIVSNTYDMLK